MSNGKTNYVFIVLKYYNIFIYLRCCVVKASDQTQYNGSKCKQFPFHECKS